MEQWQTEILRVISISLGNPRSISELVATAAFGVIVFSLTFLKLNELLKTPLSSMNRLSVLIALGLPAVIMAVSTVNLYLVPNLPSVFMRKWLPMTIMCVVLLFLVVPVSCYLHKLKYPKAFSILLLSVSAAAAIMAFVHAGFGTVCASNKGYDRVEATRQRHLKILDK